MRRLELLLCLLIAHGCSASAKYDFESGVSDTANVDYDTADTGFDDEDGVSPAWWQLGAAVSLISGLPDAASSRLSLSLIAEDGADLCEDTLAVTQIADVAEAPDPAVFSWWEVTASEPEGGCGPWRSPVPDPVYLGVGAMDPNIEANLSPAGLDDLDGNLNAAYASVDGGDTVYVFGVAGTEAAWLGVDDAATTGPLSDDTWIIKAIYPFPY